LPPAPMQVSVKVTLPVPVGATVTEPLVGWVPEKPSPMLLEEVAEHEVAFIELHCSFTPWPKLMVVAWEGALKLTEAIGVGVGIGIGEL